MDAKSLIDQIRTASAVRSNRFGMASQRNAISLLLFGKPYSSVLPAERNGKLAPPSIDDSKVEQLRTQYGDLVDVFAREARKALGGLATKMESTMTATSAIGRGDLPSLPSVSDADIENFEKIAEKMGGHLDWVTLNKRNIHQGQHLRFFRCNGATYAFEDTCDHDRPAVTVVKDNTIFQFVADEDNEFSFVGEHQFIAHVYEGGFWKLELVIHMLATEPSHYNLSREDLNEAF